MVDRNEKVDRVAIMVECYDCRHFTGKDRGGAGLKIATMGFGRCIHERDVGRYVSGSYPRECARFDLCQDGPKRREFVASQGVKYVAGEDAKC